MVVDSLFNVALIVCETGVWSLLCYAVLNVLPSFAMILSQCRL